MCIRDSLKCERNTVGSCVTPEYLIQVQHNQWDIHRFEVRVSRVDSVSAQLDARVLVRSVVWIAIFPWSSLRLRFVEVDVRLKIGPFFTRTLLR